MATSNFAAPLTNSKGCGFQASDVAKLLPRSADVLRTMGPFQLPCPLARIFRSIIVFRSSIYARGRLLFEKNRIIVSPFLRGGALRGGACHSSHTFRFDNPTLQCKIGKLNRYERCVGACTRAQGRQGQERGKKVQRWPQSHVVVAGTEAQQ